ncbi:helix-turn-helix domain-containing protein [Campylobacter showae]|jgi:transcriptional regulator, XRE family protein|uniref:helix-turn-helix domain-containing protein n=1 Tax=Campylobacter showae TaxID=204 RepID=UPI000F0813A6|nr:helix-turn-helix transcriptional regulator [Campylobacter showae]
MSKALYTSKNSALVSLLKKAREDKGMTQIELSSRIARSQSYVTKYENNERSLKVTEFIEICEALDIDPVELIKIIKNV